MTCICCGAEAFKPRFHDLIRCQHCGYQRMKDEVTPQQLQGIYHEAYYKGEKYHDYVAEKAMLQTNFEARLQAMSRYLGPPPLRLFEVGCAYGFFLELAARRFAHVQGYDIAVEPTAYARDVLHLQVGTGDFTTASLPAQSVDVVCMWDTIEHLADPLGYVQQTARLLRPGGHLFLTTGNVDSWLARLQRRRWRLYDPPQHVHYFSPASLGRLLQACGFEVAGSETCAFVHSIEQILHGLGWYQDPPGRVGRLCRWLYPRVPTCIRRLHFPIDLGDIFMIVGRRR